MTAAELIAKLESVDPETPVLFEGEYGYETDVSAYLIDEPLPGTTEPVTAVLITIFGQIGEAIEL